MFHALKELHPNQRAAIVAFGIGAERPAHGGGSGGTAVFYAVLGLMSAALLLVRLRRRRRGHIIV